MMINILITLAMAMSGLFFASTVHAQSDNLMKKFLIDDATPYINMRYRFEHVDQEGLPKNANASTLRTKLGYQTGQLYDFSANLEFENIFYLGNDNFNNTINGKSDYPVVADPDVTEFNHVFLTYQGFSDTMIKVGRQPLALGNQRFVGGVKWRQNDQTYDAATITNKSLPNTSLFYGYVFNLNRIFGDHVTTSSHLINLSYDFSSYAKLTGYAYLLDYRDSARAGLSSQTFGLNLAGAPVIWRTLKLLYQAEYAYQSDYTDNPLDYDVHYYAVEGGLAFEGAEFKIGYESLGSDGGAAGFQTPLATLHKYNGWADKFLSIPETGLQDFYVSASYKISDFKFAVIWHDFSAESGGGDYGNEWNVSVGWNFIEHYSILFKYADYNADSGSDTSDTRKIWVQLGLNF